MKIELEKTTDHLTGRINYTITKDGHYISGTTTFDIEIAKAMYEVIKKNGALSTTEILKSEEV